MTWTFHIAAAKGQRLLSRILQVLETQRVNIRAFYGEINNDEVRVTIIASSEEDRAYRIEALLYCLKDVRSISVVTAVEATKPDCPGAFATIPKISE